VAKKMQVKTKYRLDKNDKKPATPFIEELAGCYGSEDFL
jgi:hypothetical protein